MMRRFTIIKNIGMVIVIKMGGSLMEETLKEILSELQKTNSRLGNLEIGQTELGKGQKELNTHTKRLEEGQKELNARTKKLDEGQTELNTRTKRLEEGQKDLNNHTKKLS
jgi:peptidoglycan hydrolase CwlO-like protein